MQVNITELYIKYLCKKKEVKSVITIFLYWKIDVQKVCFA